MFDIEKGVRVSEEPCQHAHKGPILEYDPEWQTRKRKRAREVDQIVEKRQESAE